MAMVVPDFPSPTALAAPFTTATLNFSRLAKMLRRNTCAAKQNG
jgi:hypothetical protein